MMLRIAWKALSPREGSLVVTQFGGAVNTTKVSWWPANVGMLGPLYTQQKKELMVNIMFTLIFIVINSHGRLRT